MKVVHVGAPRLTTSSGSWKTSQKVIHGEGFRGYSELDHFGYIRLAGYLYRDFCLSTRLLWEDAK
jgi:hypothetical protein